MTRTITLDAPNTQLFAAVQIDVPDPEGRDGRRIVGAAPAFRMEEERDGTGKVTRRWMVPLPRVDVLCDLQPDDTTARAVWAYEDSSIPNEQMDVQLDEHGAQTARAATYGGA